MCATGKRGCERRHCRGPNPQTPWLIDARGTKEIDTEPKNTNAALANAMLGKTHSEMNILHIQEA